MLACDGVWDVLDDEEAAIITRLRAPARRSRLQAVVVCAEHKTADLAAHALVRLWAKMNLLMRASLWFATFHSGGLLNSGAMTT